MAGPPQPGASEEDVPGPDLSAGITDHHEGDAKSQSRSMHPSGRQSYGRVMQIVRGLAVVVYFFTCCCAIFTTQLIGAPLYVVNRDWYYAYMAMTKRSFAVTATLMTHIWGPTTIRISGDASVAGQIAATPGGGVEFNFPERIVLIANHQIYTDWIYLWWVAYNNLPRTDGHLYIILKESLKHIPFLGWGMQFYGFIFMSRKMSKDRDRMAYRLNKLKQKKVDPYGNKYLDPMWLLLFPEGTNLSGNGRRKSSAWAKKQGLRDPEHLLLPRSTGMYFCLKELQGTVDYVYDCTVAYEGIPRGKYGDEFFSLASTYFQGRPPKSVNFHWRRFRVGDIPLDDQDKFDTWLRDEWYRKDELMEEYMATERLPALPAAADDKPRYIEAQVRLKSSWEILQLFTVVAILGLIWNNVLKSIAMVRKMAGLGAGAS